MNLDHLQWPDKGWGYLPATEEVFTPLRQIQEEFNPQFVLEIGYLMGHSTTYMLEIFKGDLISISPEVDVGTAAIRKGDWVPTEDRISMYVKMKELYGERWEWLRGTTEQLRSKLIHHYHDQFDLCFVDGNHSYKNAYFDVETCSMLEVPIILVDNMNTIDVSKAVEDQGDYSLEKTYQYSSTFKGKTTVIDLCVFSLAK
jgi:predicted O-methyltransferase YrrM